MMSWSEWLSVCMEREREGHVDTTTGSFFYMWMVLSYAGEKAIGRSGKVLVDFMIVVSQIGKL